MRMLKLTTSELSDGHTADDGKFRMTKNQFRWFMSLGLCLMIFLLALDISMNSRCVSVYNYIKSFDETGLVCMKECQSVYSMKESVLCEVCRMMTEAGLIWKK